jgi:MerR family transcriptional regulator, heat shock protein HspR
MSSPFGQSDDLPVYVISVAAQLSGMHPQTLREYERRGLVSPGRSGGGGRRYSMRDILALREIQRLSQDEGVNLSGIKLILSQLRELEQARRLIAELHAEVAQLRVELESTRAVAARLAELRRSGSDNDPGLVPVRRGRVAIWEPMSGPSSGAGQPRGDK